MSNPLAVTSYNNNIIQPSNYGITKVNISGDPVHLTWPSVYADSSLSLNAIVTLNASIDNRVVYLPDESLGSNGYSFIVINTGNYTVSIHKYNSTEIDALDSGEAKLIILEDKDSENPWIIKDFLDGGASIQSVTLVQPSSGLLISTNNTPITSSATVNFSLTGIIQDLSEIGSSSSAGLLFKSASGNLILGNILAAAGDNNITVQYGTGLDLGKIYIGLTNSPTFSSIKIGDLTIDGSSFTTKNEFYFNCNLSLADGGILIFSSRNSDKYIGIGSPDDLESTYNIKLPPSLPTIQNSVLIANIEASEEASCNLSFSENLSSMPANATDMRDCISNTAPVTPAMVLYNPGASKSMGSFSGQGSSGPVPLISSYRVNSVSKNDSDGYYTINIASQGNTNYGVFVTTTKGIPVYTVLTASSFKFGVMSSADGTSLINDFTCWFRIYSKSIT